MSDPQGLPEIRPCSACGSKPSKQITYMGTTDVHYECCDIRTKQFPNNRSAIECWNRTQPVRKRAYYAHSVGLYDTPQEDRDEQILRTLGFDVLNPNAPGINDRYEDEGMSLFRKLIDRCDALAFRAHPDTKISAGVSKEISFARVLSVPVFELPAHVGRRTLSVDLTRQYLRETGVR